MTEFIPFDEVMSQDPPAFDSSVALIVDSQSTPIELRQGLAHIIKSLDHVSLYHSHAIPVQNDNVKWFLSFQNDPNLDLGQYSMTPMDQTYDIMIRYRRTIDAFRAVGKLLGAAKASLSPFGDILGEVPSQQGSEQAEFVTQGVMIDCSRNGVLRESRVKQLLCYMALMGLNMLQLYTEDTYEVEEEPLVGYLRGKYSRTELGRIDDYANDLGIEVIPCIQVLGHLGQVLQWPQFAHLRDNTEVILANYEPTYEFLEKLIKAASGTFRSKRIHIGCDEAYGLGEGRYRQLFGYKDPTDIFLDHIRRVMEICSRYDLEPMIWSDMLFCLAAKNNTLQGYYDLGSAPNVNDRLPEACNLVFWDYYHTTEDVYEHKLQQHHDLGCTQPWMANAAWTWSRFWTALPFTFQSVRASTVASKHSVSGVQHAFITIWGDEGNECDMQVETSNTNTCHETMLNLLFLFFRFSALPGILYYAQLGHCKGDQVDISILKHDFAGICGGRFDDWVYASKIDDAPNGHAITDKSHYAPNISKWLLWEDPMLGFLSPQYKDQDLEAYYGLLADELMMKKKDAPENGRLELPARVARVLSLKCHLRDRCALAYKQDDLATLSDLVHHRLTALQQETDALWQCHRRLWHDMYKPFGWEVLELRYGGLRTRLATMHHRLSQYSDDEDKGDGIPEFEADLQPLFFGSTTNLLLDYARVASPSRPG
ncbi:glycoside hydrolase [Hesseltinella vesiculosa]|uniref:beta-N-acetylhexosaminidase n=1 Tax=Hesseltinella vesiculosa TaxID=101127 RepID=A0A1X2GHR8_9FUNG|nr:glycoside hydrolase [Hesseltinella vesiculosa]